MKYKPSDKVRIKSLDWYNMHCDDAGNVDCGCEIFEKDMKPYLGKVFTIHRIVDNSKYEMEEAFDFFLFTDEMIEGLVEEEISQNAKLVSERFSEYVNPSEVKYAQDTITKMLLQGANIPNDYILKDENGNIINATKIVLEKKKKEYPNNIYHCARTLGLHSHPDDASKYKTELIHKLQTLLVCRDAYWKIAGEEMGLGKPWEPDWSDASCSKYIIDCFGGEICKGITAKQNTTFAFPTEEIRNAFKENFDKDLEICKEFL